MLYDLSPPLSPQLPVWPGDAPLAYDRPLDMQRGDRVTLSTVHLTAHLGAHVDAPAHATLGGLSIDQCDLALFVGPCRVMQVPTPPRGLVTPAALNGPIDVPRLLLATGTYTRPAAFHGDFAGLSLELIDYLHAAGVRLIGVDTPSVDRFADEDLPAHRRLGQHGIWTLEGLVLADIPPGRYELAALPLRLVGCEASPVRAVLRTLSDASA
jgi:arylformamidase